MDLLDRMATFVRIVEAGSLSAAARKGGVSLAAVSRQLGALEEELGASLIARTTRRLHVTEAGRRWYEHSVRLLRGLEEARADVADPGDARGALVVSAPVSLGVHCVVPRLPALAVRHPSLAIELRLEDRVVDLLGDGVDVAIRGGVAPPDSAALVSHPLFGSERVVVASPAYLRGRGAIRHPSDLARHDALLQRGPGGAPQSWPLRSADARHDAPVRGRLSCTAPLVLRQWALAGAGMALLPSWLVADDLASGALRRVLSSWSTAPIRSWALYRVDLRRSPKVRALLDALTSEDWTASDPP